MARLLLVDDDPETLTWMELALRRAGHEVQSASNVQRALSVLDHWRPDLVVSDVLMPEADGWSLARHIAREGIPFIFLSVVAAEAQGILRGCTGYLRKPVTPAHLRAEIARALGEVHERRTILVADDDPELRLAFRTILEPSFDVLTAENGAEALRLLEQHDVTMLITDVRMPVMDGRELVRSVRRDPRWARLPVLVQTGDREAARFPEWRELHVERVMTKEEFTDLLLMCIDQTLAETQAAHNGA